MKSVCYVVDDNLRTFGMTKGIVWIYTRLVFCEKYRVINLSDVVVESSSTYQLTVGSNSSCSLCGDVGNSLFVDVSANDVFDTFADSIRHVHVKDYGIGDQPSEKEMYWKSRGGKYIFDREMGQGVTDFAYCFAKLKQIGYQSAVSFEISGDDQYLTRAIDFIKTFL